MHELTESGVLVPMRVFPARALICAALQLPVANGRTQRLQSEAWLSLATWLPSGGNLPRTGRRSFSGATIAHCEEMARSFNDAGIMAACFTSDTRETERAALLAEYRKPDSTLRVLLSVNALAKDLTFPTWSAYATCARFAKA